MAANLGIGVLIGSIPIFGDLFDIVWRLTAATTRLPNSPPGRAAPPQLRDWAFLGLLAAIFALIFAIPIFCDSRCLGLIFAWLSANDAIDDVPVV